jgi:hypothetical protein
MILAGFSTPVAWMLKVAVILQIGLGERVYAAGFTW